MSPTARLTRGPVGGHVWKLMVPMTLGILSILSKNLVDTYFVAQLGTEALSAISFTFPVVLFVMSLSIGLGAGAASVLARVYGEGDLARVQRRATDALILAVALGLLASVAGVLAVRPIFRLLGAEGRILDLVVEYMTPWFWGLDLLVFVMVSNSLLRAAGDAKWPGMLMVAAAAINAILDPLLIFGGLGVPALGIAGAAWATVLSNVFAAAGSIALMVGRERMISLRPASPAAVWASWKPILAIGLPATVANMINPLGVGVVTRVLADVGPSAVAAFGVATRLEGLALVALLALSAAVGPVVGQNYGARRVDRVVESMRYCFRLSVKWCAVMAVLLAVFGPLVVPIFDDSPEVRRLASVYLWLVPVTYFGYGWNIVQSAAFNALGRPVLANVMTLGRMFVAYVPVALLLSRVFEWGAIGVFVGAMVGNLVGGAAAWVGRTWLDRSLRA